MRRDYHAAKSKLGTMAERNGELISRNTMSFNIKLQSQSACSAFQEPSALPYNIYIFSL